VIRVSNFLKARNDVNSDRIGGIAFDEICPSLLHAAALDKSIHSVTLVGALISYRSMVMNELYQRSLSDYAVAGALTAYDLPDLIGCLAPRKIALIGLTDQMKQPASTELIGEELAFPRFVYSRKSVAENLNVITSNEDIGGIVDWCFE
jgi:hypothetical protein